MTTYADVIASPLLRTHAALLVQAVEEVADLVTAQVGGSALFASRFRECAARALLLPRRRPGRRQALWQQRQRASQLLEVASRYPAFPIVLEAVRECVQDVFDVPGLVGLMRAIRSREVGALAVQTRVPSPFARSLLFGYVAQYLYEGDSPLAERRAAALALDPTLLAELLGTGDGLSLRDLLDPDVVTAALRFLVSDPAITTALVGFSAMEELEAAVNALHGFSPRPPEHLETLRAGIERGFNEMCTGCGYCIPCPVDVQIPKLMDAFNQKILEGTDNAIKERLKWHWSLPADAAALCTECGACEEACTQHLPIRERTLQAVPA